MCHNKNLQITIIEWHRKRRYITEIQQKCYRKLNCCTVEVKNGIKTAKNTIDTDEK